MSVTSPARAKVPSKRSWLRSVFSGTRPARARSEASGAEVPLPAWLPPPHPAWPGRGVEGHDVADVRGWNRGWPSGGQDVGGRGAAQQRVELMELAPLPLPAHPASLRLVPAAG